MEYKGYEVITRASQLPAGHFKARFAVYPINSGGVHEVVYQGVIASPDYTNAAAAEAEATRAARAWINTQARMHSPRPIRLQRADAHKLEPGRPISFAYV